MSAGAAATVTEADGVVSFTLVVRRKGEEGDLFALGKKVQGKNLLELCPLVVLSENGSPQPACMVNYVEFSNALLHELGGS